jgi:hypothetical protein
MWTSLEERKKSYGAIWAVNVNLRLIRIRGGWNVDATPFFQSSYYAMQIGKKAGIVLILETMKDRKYWIRLNTTIEQIA